MTLKQTRHTLLSTAAVLGFHALLLALLLWVWPRIERARSVNESTRIEVSLATLDAPEPKALIAAQAAAATNAATVKPKRRAVTLSTLAPRASLSMEPPALASPVKPADIEAVLAPSPAASAPLSSAATKDAIKRTLENKTLAQQARAQLGTLRALSIDEQLGVGIKQAEIPECLGPNAGGSLLLAPKLIYDALKGKCK